VTTAWRAVLAPNPSPLTGRGTNTWILAAGGEAVVVDPGPDDAAHLAAVAAAAREAGRVRAVLLTHHHLDHSAGAPALSRALEAPLLGRRHPEGPALDRQLADGEALPLGAETLVAVATPGHAADHLCFHWPAREALLTGDLIAGEGYIVIDPPEGDMALYLGSLRRAAALRPAVLLPGHGPETPDAAARVEAYLEHRLAREARVLAAVGKGGGGLDDLLPLAYEDTPEALWPLARRSLLAHLEKLVGDGAVATSGAGQEARYRLA